MTSAQPPASARLSRLLALVPWLTAHDGATLAQTAAHFGVSEQTLTDDLWLLVCTGLPGYGPGELVDIQFWDDGGRIHVVDPQALERPLRLSPDEAMALLVGLRLLRRIPGDHDRAALDSAAEKLAAVAGAAADAADRVAVDVEAPGPAAVAVDRALRSGRALSITYAGAADDSATERVVDPMRVLVADGRTYLEAWCRRACGVRTFRLDRILGAEVLPTPATPPDNAEPTVLVHGGLRPAGEAVTVELDDVARWVAEAHRTQSVEPLDGGRVRAVLTVADRGWLVRLVLRLGGTARVVAPPDAVEAVRRAAAAALRG